VAVWLYLVLVGWVMLRADHSRLRRTAVAQAESAATVLVIVCIACVVSLLGIVVELSAAKQPAAPHALPHVLFAPVTVGGSWLLLPMIFTLTYASVFYHSAHGSGLLFPGADVSITSARLRRLVTLHAVLSFVFNTAILALTINTAASLF
jgi:uncharacterized membrane protein